MKIRMKKEAYSTLRPGHHKPGDVVDFPDTIALTLIQDGKAEAYQEEDPHALPGEHPGNGGPANQPEAFGREGVPPQPDTPQSRTPSDESAAESGQAKGPRPGGR